MKKVRSVTYSASCTRGVAGRLRGWLGGVHARSCVHQWMYKWWMGWVARQEPTHFTAHFTTQRQAEPLLLPTHQVVVEGEHLPFSFTHPPTNTQTNK